MRKDPIVEEIHKVREAHAKRFHYDLDAIFADMQKKQSHMDNVVDLTPEPKSGFRVAERRAGYGSGKLKPRRKMTPAD
jgi:hypothetical protein